MPISDRYATRPETKEGIEENLFKLVQERKLNRTIGKDESGLSALLNSYRAQADKTLEDNQDVQPSFGTQALIGLLPIAAGALAGAFGPKGGRGESMALGGATGAKAGLQGLETLEKGRKERKDLREKALKSSIDIQKMQSDVSKQQQDRLESGQKVDVELGKMLSQMQEASAKGDISKDLKKESAKSFVEKRNDRLYVANKLDRTVEILSDPTRPLDEKILEAQATARTLNAEMATGDAVQKEEAARLLYQLDRINFSRPGKTFGRDLKGFTRGLVSKSNRYRKEASDMNNWVNKIMADEELDYSQKPIPSSVAVPGQSLTKEQLEKMSESELEKLYKSIGN
jgi:hypothetical protein